MFMPCFNTGFGFGGGPYCGFGGGFIFGSNPSFIYNPFMANPLYASPFPMILSNTYNMCRYIGSPSVYSGYIMPSYDSQYSSMPSYTTDVNALRDYFIKRIPVPQIYAPPSSEEEESSDKADSSKKAEESKKTEKPKKPEKTADKTKTGNKKTGKTSAVGKSWDKMTDEELRAVYGNYTRDITKKYTGGVDKLNKYLKGKGVLEGKGQAFIDAQEKYGISASVLIGICMNESGKGTSNLAKTKNNVGGVRIPGSSEFKSFSSVAECIDYMASFLKSGYVENSTRSLTKLYEVNARYCPVTDPTDTDRLNSGWASAVDRYASEVEKVDVLA